MSDTFGHNELETAYRSYADEIFRFCVFRMRDRESAKDVVQEAFCRAWEYVRKGGDIGHTRAFLYRTVRNIIIDLHRRKKAVSLDALAESQLGFDSPSPDHERIYESSEVARVLSNVNALSDDLREVFLLRFVNDIPPSEIAHILEINPNLVSVRIHRAVSAMKEIMKTSAAHKQH